MKLLRSHLRFLGLLDEDEVIYAISPQISTYVLCPSPKRLNCRSFIFIGRCFKDSETFIY